ncbi:hypothetical protein JHK86_000239 [Glycine max]|nr:hypothetical protein JHK86_000239 [Glycine max]
MELEEECAAGTRVSLLHNNTCGMKGIRGPCDKMGKSNVSRCHFSDYEGQRHGSNKASSFNGHGQGDPRVTLDQENADTHLASKSDPMISGHRTKKVGVVDSEYVFHKGIQTLGGSDHRMTKKQGGVGIDVRTERNTNPLGKRNKAKSALRTLQIKSGANSKIYFWMKAAILAYRHRQQLD